MFLKYLKGALNKSPKNLDFFTINLIKLEILRFLKFKLTQMEMKNLFWALV